MRLALLLAALSCVALPVAAQQSPPAHPVAALPARVDPAVLEAQVLLDRNRFSPGVIDGIMGSNTAQAIRAYRKANGLPGGGELDPPLLTHLRQSFSGDVIKSYAITASDVKGPFIAVPTAMEDMAGLKHIGYGSPAELLAEKFHMDIALLRALNPGADFVTAGTEIRVLATIDAPIEATVARIEVDKANVSVRAYDAGGRLLARFPATIGSSTFPSPSGSMEVLTVAPEATYHFSPEGRDWGPDRALTIAAGPNNPVGGIWIDLSKEGYGIHGTPDPSLIGKTASHGCVRLTNWDAARLAAAVRKGTAVNFI